jgi:SAGA-associated factor 73
MAIVDEEATIKVASKKQTAKDKPNGTIKLKKPAPKHTNPGNWLEGGYKDSMSHISFSATLYSVLKMEMGVGSLLAPRPQFQLEANDAMADDKKSKAAAAAASAITAASPGPVVNPLDDSARETFATGRPLEDSPDLQQCKHCKKSILKTAAKAHIAACLKVKKEKAQRKKEAREARERAREAAREEEARKADEEAGIARADDDSDEDGEDKKRLVSGKTTKSAAMGGKKTDGLGDSKGSKKRKADGELDKGPKKKKKDEPKTKAPKPKGKAAARERLTSAKRRIQARLMSSGSVV